MQEVGRKRIIERWLEQHLSAFVLQALGSSKSATFTQSTLSHRMSTECFDITLQYVG